MRLVRLGGGGNPARPTGSAPPAETHAIVQDRLQRIELRAAHVAVRVDHDAGHALARMSRISGSSRR